MGNDEVVSVEMVEYLDVGGAIRTQVLTVNYNLKTNKPLRLNDVFRGAMNTTIIAEFAAKDINRRAEQMDNKRLDEITANQKNATSQ